MDASKDAVVRWVRRHGWEYQQCVVSERTIHPYRLRWRVARTVMEQHPCDAVLYLDNDILPMTWEPLPEFAGEVAFSGDRYGLCAGAWVVRNTHWGRWFVESAFQMIPDTPKTRTEDQDVLKVLTRMRAVRGKVDQLPETFIANPQSEVRGPAMMHYWAHHNPEGVLETIRREAPSLPK